MIKGGNQSGIPGKRGHKDQSGGEMGEGVRLQDLFVLFHIGS